MSDRRWGKTHGVLRAHALLEGRSAIEEDDLAVLKHVLWSSPDQQAEISRLCARLSNPISGKATELTDQAASVYDATMVAHGQSGDTQQKVVVVAEGIDKLKAIHAGLVQHGLRRGEEWPKPSMRPKPFRTRSRLSAEVIPRVTAEAERLVR